MYFCAEIEKLPEHFWVLNGFMEVILKHKSWVIIY